MKKLICILLAILTMSLTAFAEGAHQAAENPFAPFTLTAPEGVALEDNEGTHAFVSGMTRVVTMIIDRVPDEDPAEAILRLMYQFEPNAVIEDELALEGGCVGLTACSTDKFGEGIDQWNVMILSLTGDLLILSGYDLEGDEDKVHTLLDALLIALTVDGAPIIIK